MLSLVLSAFADCQPDPEYEEYTYVDGVCLTTDLSCNGECSTWQDHLQNPGTGERFYTCKNTEEVSYLAVERIGPTTIANYFDSNGNLIGWGLHTHEIGGICCEGYYGYSLAYGAVFDCDSVEILTDTATPDTDPDKSATCGCTTSPLSFTLAPLLLFLRRPARTGTR